MGFGAGHHGAHGVPAARHDHVRDDDAAIGFFTDALGFDLVEDSAAVTDDGRTKRWVVVRPPGAQTGILLARADGDRQLAALGDQHAGRVGFFLDISGNCWDLIQAGPTHPERCR